MTPSIGRIVHYCLTTEDAEGINDQRARRQVHVGNAATAGDVYPAIVVWKFDGDVLNLQMFLDGPDAYWVTSRVEGEVPGTWRWPARS